MLSDHVFSLSCRHERAGVKEMAAFVVTEYLGAGLSLHASAH